MKHLDNDVARIAYDEALHESISKLCLIIKSNPYILTPYEGADKTTRTILSDGGFELYPTVKTTTLFYEPDTNCFFKILHPLKLKNKFRYCFSNKSRHIYDVTEYLHAKGISAQRVVAYGTFTRGRRPVFAIKKAEGKCLYDILIREKQTLKMDEYKKVIAEVVKLHSLGYWLGDAHLSHIFIMDGEVSGIIDIDSIRKNRPFMLKKLAKDIAGLNHPELPLTKNEKRDLLTYYMESLAINDVDRFIWQVKYYTERRWKA